MNIFILSVDDYWIDFILIIDQYYSELEFYPLPVIKIGKILKSTLVYLELGNLMHTLNTGFREDLKLSIYIILFLEIAIASLVVVPIESNPYLSSRPALRFLGAMLYLLPILTYLLYRWKPAAARWFSVVAPSAIIFYVAHWLQIPMVLALLAIPVGIAATLISLPAAVVTAAGHTAMLMASQRIAGSPDWTTMVISVIAMGGFLALFAGMIYPVRSVVNWSYEYFQKAKNLLEDSRKRQGELNQALKELAHANRQLSLLHEKQTALQRIAEEAEKTKSAFVAKVSHEFRTPLNMIIGLAGVMIENPKVYGRSLPPAMLEDLRIIERNCEHLSSLVNDVLALSQAQAGQLVLRKEKVSISKIIGEAQTVISPLLAKKGLSFQLKLPPDLPDVWCDQTRIRQVILNLFSNAARFTEQGGISVQVEDRSKSLLIQVSDTGPGISKEDIESIFEPFCQGTRPWQDKDGSGLGLTISKQFVELHGGEIWLESELGKGTTFYVLLPKQGLVELDSSPLRWLQPGWEWVERKPGSVLKHTPQRPRILLCDDTGELQGRMGSLSNKVELVNKANLEEIIRELDLAPAHAILVNTATPSDLWHLHLKVRPQIADTPLVCCLFPRRVPRALKAGAEAYLVKPIQYHDIRETLQKMDRPIRRVLIADDDADTRSLLTRMLSLYNPDIKIDAASGGNQALNKLHASKPDLVLLDLVMPDIDGLRFLDLKSQDPRIRDIPVVVISAQDPNDDPMLCQGMFITLGSGLSPVKVLESTLAISSLIFRPDTEPYQVH